MPTPYQAAFAACALVTAFITLRARSASAAAKVQGSPEFVRFQRIFLAVYYVAMTADWLQGPYVYALYSSYGFPKHDIAVLFVGGFGASMVFGTVVGAMADRLGRKRMCQLYCVLYIASCATKHSSDYWMLMVGRVLGGIATSLLFSAFESWLVCEHNARGFDSTLLSDTFSRMYFGNSLCAILAGIVAQAAADAMALTPLAVKPWHYGGYCTPFDLSATCLVVCLFLITSYWNENYGAESAHANAGSTASTLRAAVRLLSRDRRVLLCGACVSLFEGSMYIFVFNWTPAISAVEAATPPFGLIFSTFMVACMGGASLFSILSATWQPARMLRATFVVAAAALAVPIAMPESPSSLFAILGAFLLFEGAVGVYWPSIGTVKSRVVPEEARATMYNIYRIPLNAIVLAVLLNQMSVSTAFMYTTAMLAAAALCMHALAKRISDDHELPGRGLLNGQQDDY